MEHSLFFFFKRFLNNIILGHAVKEFRESSRFCRMQNEGMLAPLLVLLKFTSVEVLIDLSVLRKECYMRGKFFSLPCSYFAPVFKNKTTLDLLIFFILICSFFSQILIDWLMCVNVNHTQTLSTKKFYVRAIGHSHK